MFRRNITYRLGLLILAVFALIMIPAIPAISLNNGHTSQACVQKACCGPAKHLPKKDCSKTACTCILSCCNQGFIRQEDAFKLPDMIILRKVYPNMDDIRELPDYNSSNWNPPENTGSIPV